MNYLSCKHLFSCLTLCFVQISDLLGRETALCNTLWALKDAAQKTFFDILKTRGEKLLRYPPLVSVDLSPPPAVREGVSVLLEIIQNHDSMMVPASGKKPVFDPVIAALLDPIIQVFYSTLFVDLFPSFHEPTPSSPMLQGSNVGCIRSVFSLLLLDCIYLIKGNSHPP